MFVSPTTASTPHASSTNSSNSSNSSTGLGSLGDPTSMFISLLTAELQQQDPTSPLDPNQMVSQIVSLGQLDQLIQMNQTLSNALSPGNSSASNLTH